MKKIAAALCAFAMIFLCACEKAENEEPTKQYTEPMVQTEQMRGVWLTCYELNPMFASGTEAGFESAAEKVIENCVKHNLNTIFVQVRPFCDSIYPSEIFGWSKYALSSGGTSPDYDALQILVRLSHAADIKIHAWINPYRVSYSTDYDSLDSACPALNEKYRSSTVLTEDGIYFNPASLAAQNLVLDGIREILKNYDVDGIHIDDYFYPTKSVDFDKADYEKYVSSGGLLDLADWRRENVNALVSAIYVLVKSAGSRLLFSISPAADAEKNYSDLYADVSEWFGSTGYADIIIPQIYFGFLHETMPFEAVLSEWKQLAQGSRVQLVCGLALYKSGKADDLAGSGSDEWTVSDEVIERQIKTIESDSACNGYVLFSYKDIS